MHDHRVGGRDIKAGFDDAGGEQHIIFAIVKRVHLVIQGPGGHLAMGNDDADFGHMVAQKRFDFRQIADPWHHVERLSTAVMFAQQRLADGDGVKLGHIGADRQPVDWRGGNNAQLAHAGQRHLQRARDRRGGQGQDMDIAAQLLQLLFVLHPKMLFFVDDQQAKVLEPHRFGQNGMGADDDIHGAPGQAVAREIGIPYIHKA